MNVTYTYRHMDSSTALEERVAHHLAKVKKFTPETLDIHCIFAIEGHRNMVEINVRGSHNSFSAHDAKEDMYKAIDSTFAKLEKQLVRKKEKVKSH